MKKIWTVIKCLFGFGSIKDGSVCQATELTGIEFHDYPVSKGGDGYPQHFDYYYVCPNCGKRFEI